MASVNIAPLGVASSVITLGNEVYPTDISYVNDDNTSTSYDIATGTFPSTNLSADIIIELDDTYLIDTLEVSYIPFVNSSSVLLFNVFIFNGSWVQIGTETANSSDSGTSVLASFTGSWTGVSKIKMEIIGFRNFGDILIFTEEFRAFGLSGGVDAGLRYTDGETIFGIGTADNSDDYPLKYYDGTNIRGIILVDTTDANASPIRIFDGTNIKAFSQITL